ncbi:MAG: hypothetical protein OXC44_03755 [Proteobacteria bacterium]|nr:hypothetical protein [Pseudomonadota bacterium]
MKLRYSQAFVVSVVSVVSVFVAVLWSCKSSQRTTDSSVYDVSSSSKFFSAYTIILKEKSPGKWFFEMCSYDASSSRPVEMIKQGCNNVYRNSWNAEVFLSGDSDLIKKIQQEESFLNIGSVMTDPGNFLVVRHQVIHALEIVQLVEDALDHYRAYLAQLQKDSFVENKALADAFSEEIQRIRLKLETLNYEGHAATRLKGIWLRNRLERAETIYQKRTEMHMNDPDRGYKRLSDMINIDIVNLKTLQIRQASSSQLLAGDLLAALRESGQDVMYICLPLVGDSQDCKSVMK